MKKEKIICKLKESYKYKKKYWVISGIVVFSAIFCITVVKPPKFIKDSKLYIQSLIDGDPSYEKLKEKVSLYVYKKEISLKEFEEGTIVKKEDEIKGPITASAIKSGFDGFTPSEIPKDDTTTETSTYSNNALNNGSSSNNYYVEEKPSSNNSNNTSSSNDNEKFENKKEEFIDKSSFVGKDLMIYEGDKFDPLKNLKLSATDIDGSNITNKIVITENTVDTYKPGLYTVKANVQLSDNTKLEKDFLVRVEATALELAVNDIEFSKDILQKKESYTMNFKVDSSKNYLDVHTVNINGEMYYPNKTTRRRLFTKEEIYSVQLVASDKAGIEDIKFNTITMTDGTVVDINELKTVEVLKDEASIKDMVIDNISDDGEVAISFFIKDIDDTISKAKLYVYDEKENVIVEKEVEKNKTINSILNVNKNGVYKIKIVADENVEFVAQDTKDSKRKELYSTSIEVKNARFSDDSIKEANVDIASYIVYNDESDFINGLFLRKSISKYELQSGDEEGSQEPPIGSEQPDGSEEDSSDVTPNPNPDQSPDQDSGNSDGSDDGDDGTSSGGTGGSGSNDKNDSDKEDPEYIRQYATGDKLQVTIPTNGKMTEDSGTTSQKRINVTVPTNAIFTVRNDSSFIGASLNITNNGEAPVDISVAEFIDVDGDYGIKLVTDEDVNNDNSRTTYKRNEINLWLENEAESKKIYLGNRKLYSQLASSEYISKDEDKKIATVLNHNTSRIDIGGKAGTNALDKDQPIQNRFTLILKIKKSTQNGISK